MAKVFRQSELTFSQRKSPIPEFAWHMSPKLDDIVKSILLKFDVKSIDPGKYSYPYHFHRNAEELFVVLSGSATLRTPEGFEEISEGDIMYFEIGPSGAHQIYNHTKEPCKYIDIRTFTGLDVCEYPDSGKVNILPYMEIYKTEDRVDYYNGEDKVSEKWPAEIVNKSQE
jgi:uncharacterized cupin superfamily protein